MNTWIYNNKTFTSKSIDWNKASKSNLPEEIVKVPGDSLFGKFLVYHPRWDKCFWLTCLGMHGNGSRLKAYIEDVYNEKGCWVEARNLEIVLALD